MFWCCPRFAKPKNIQGFTLIELLIVVAIIGILAAVIVVAINPSARFQDFYLNKSKEQLGILVRATEAYALTQGEFPPDVDRDIPTALLDDLRGDQWPKAPWPGSVFDWDNIPATDVTYEPRQPYKQYSIRFCDINGNNCKFPDFEWAEDFDTNSSVYYCISGPCRPHKTMPMNYPGFCVGNCPE